jgi:hypothetical protein
MKPTTAILATLLLAPGCAQMGTRQTDTNTTTRYEITPEGQTNAITTEVRETATRSTGRAVLSGKNTFEGLDASQDGDSQGLKVSKSGQENDGMRQFVDAMRLGAQMGAMMYGIPPQAAPATRAPMPEMPPRPPRMKWKLVPVDDPSESQPEVEQP